MSVSSSNVTVRKTPSRETDARKIHLLAAPSLALAMAMCAGSASASEPPEFAAIRAATEKYQDVDAALADGYIRDPDDRCITAESEGMPAELGGMGIHYLRPDRLEITAVAPRVDGTGTYTDFVNPAILLYEPQADGSLELVGVENLVFQAAWKAAGHDTPPKFAGRIWDAMADDPSTEADEAHRFTPHFDQHVWLYRDNPNGNLVPFNPNVSCDYHTPQDQSG